MLKILLSFLLSIRMFGTMYLSSSYEKYIFWFYKRSPVHFLLLNLSESYAAPKNNLTHKNSLEPLLLTQLSSIRQKLISNSRACDCDLYWSTSLCAILFSNSTCFKSRFMTNCGKFNSSTL